MTTRLNLTGVGTDGTLLSSLTGVSLHSGSSDLVKISSNRLYTDSAGGNATALYDIFAATTTVHQTIECDLYFPALGGRKSVPTLFAGGFQFYMNFADDLGLLVAPGGGQLDSEHTSASAVPFTLTAPSTHHVLLEVTSTGAKVFLDGALWLQGSDATGTAGTMVFGFLGSGTPTDGVQMLNIFARDFAVGAASKLYIATPAKRCVSGGLFAIQPVIEVHDADDLLVTTSTATIAASSSVAGCLPTGTLSAAAVAGVRTFTDLGWNGATSDAAIVYSSSGLTSATDHPPVGVNSPLAIPSTATVTIGAHSAIQVGTSTGATTSAIDTTGYTTTFIACAPYVGATSPTVSDSKGNTYVKDFAVVDGSGMVLATLYRCANPIVGTGHTATSSAGTALYCPLMLFGIVAASAAPAAPDRLKGSGTASGTTIKPGALTPGLDKEIVITVVALAGDGLPLTVDSGFTLLGSVDHIAGTSFGVGVAYKIQTTAVAVDVQWTQTGSAGLGAGVGSYTAG